MIHTLVFYDGITVENKSYNCCRIPVLIKTPKDTLLAFCEGRPSCSDNGCIDTLIRRSNDNGLTWSDPKIVYGDKNNVYGNPCPIVDTVTDRIHLLMTWNKGDLIEKDIMKDATVEPRIPYYCYSDDDGLNWTTPISIRDQGSKPEWRWYSTGPGNGVQISTDKYKNRLIAPCNHSTLINNDHYEAYHSHLLYSDDHGISWNIGMILPSYTNESCIVELSEGVLMHNMRLENEYGRGVSISLDGGETSSTYYKDNYLDVAVCQGSIVKVGDILLYSGPSSYNRENLTVFASYDNGKTWSAKKTVYKGSCGYSSLVEIDDKHFGILYERDCYNKIVYKMLPIDWLSVDKTDANVVKWYYKPYISNDPDVDVVNASKIEIDTLTSAYLEDMYQIRLEADVYNITIDDKTYRIRFEKNRRTGLDMELVELDEHCCLKWNICDLCIHELIREKN